MGKMKKESHSNKSRLSQLREWYANYMYKKKERNFRVTSTFDQLLQSYTVQKLDTKNKVQERRSKHCSGVKDLVPWEDSASDGEDFDLNGGTVKKWDVNDMFKKNEQDFGVTSTFDPSLKGYTLQLEKQNTIEFKEAEANDSKITNKIENKCSYKASIQLDIRDGREDKSCSRGKDLVLCVESTSNSDNFDLNGSTVKGLCTNDVFKKNEQDSGKTSVFDQSLQSYTVALQKLNIKDKVQTNRSKSCSSVNNRVPWIESISNGNKFDLSRVTEKGWDTNDMFKKNEEDFGVTSTLDPSLQSYTIPSEKPDTKDKIQRRRNKNCSKIKNLVPWVESTSNSNKFDLNGVSEKGWNGNDMFKKNEKDFGVTSTFVSSLQSYTIPLEKQATKHIVQRSRNKTCSRIKNLVPWVESTSNSNKFYLNGVSENGWNANDMFKKNEQSFGVISTFDPSLQRYTIPLEKPYTKDKVHRSRNKSCSRIKNLVPWVESTSNGNNFDLNCGTMKGWDASDMFMKNEQDFSVTSTFDPSLQSYTTPLEKQDTKEKVQGSSSKSCLRVKGLVPWVEFTSNGADFDLYGGSAIDWDANDMFKKKKNCNFGMTSNFDQSFQGYTDLIQKPDTNEKVQGSRKISCTWVSELVPWIESTSNGEEFDLNGGSVKGWDANDMFEKNEQAFGVISTFDQSFKGYTVPLQKQDTKEFKEAEAKASKIANEIENHHNYKAMMELDIGDREERYEAAASSKDLSNDTTNIYMHPTNGNTNRLGSSFKVITHTSSSS